MCLIVGLLIAFTKGSDMKQHTVAFGGLATDMSAGNVTQPFIADDLIRANSNVMQLTEDWKSTWSFSGGTGLNRVRVSAASLRIRGFPFLTPLAGNVLAGDLPIINDMRDFPLTFRAGENVTLQGTNGAANPNITLLNMVRGEPNYNVNVTGLRKIRFTATVTGVSFGWSTPANVVLDDDIEYGTYAVFGFSVFEAATLGARLVFKDQVERPGIVACQSVNQRPWDKFYGYNGLYGTFQTLTPPFIQNLANAAGANSLIGHLFVAKV